MASIREKKWGKIICPCEVSAHQRRETITKPSAVGAVIHSCPCTTHQPLLPTGWSDTHYCIGLWEDFSSNVRITPAHTLLLFECPSEGQKQYNIFEHRFLFTCSITDFLFLPKKQKLALNNFLYVCYLLGFL